MRLNTGESSTPTRLRGHVKWFDPLKGFGFIVPEGGGGDVLLHANVLRNFGQSSVADGAVIEVLAQGTARGYQAVEVLSICPPETAESAQLEDLANIDPGTLARSELEPARVKWFDPAKGFGFANVYGKAEDVFLHMEVLRRSGLANLQPGEAIVIRAIEGRRGRMAVEILTWEAGLSGGQGK